MPTNSPNGWPGLCSKCGSVNRVKIGKNLIFPLPAYFIELIYKIQKYKCKSHSNLRGVIVKKDSAAPSSLSHQNIF